MEKLHKCFTHFLSFAKKTIELLVKSVLQKSEKNEHLWFILFLKFVHNGVEALERY